MIEVRDVTKRFGNVDALVGVDLCARDGRVTGFLGPNGAGKSTTLRILMGHLPADRGVALIDGKPITELDRPASHVGAALNPASHHPDRSGRDHLRVLAAAAGVDDRRVDEVLDLTDLTGAAKRRAGGYSTGMKQRLHLAAALLARPNTLVLDEPTNGLDPQGMRWLRQFLRGFASDGGCVLLSSHVLGEVAHTVDDVVVVRRGRVVASGALDAVFPPSVSLLVRCDRPDPLAEALRAAGGVTTTDGEPGQLRVRGVGPEVVARAALDLRILVTELTPVAADLERRFFELTDDDPHTAEAA